MGVVENCLLGLAHFLCLPCIWLWDYNLQRSHDYRDGRRAPPASKPAALSSRRRALTLPLPNNMLTRRRPTNSQCGSSLFAKLPYEIRMQIWEECIGGQTVHLYQHHRRMHGLVCQTPDDPQGSNDHNCWRLLRRERNFARGTGLIVLPVTCRRIYSETIKILYSLNVFDFSPSYLCLLHLPRYLRPPRLNTIAQVYFIWEGLKFPPNITRFKKHDHYDKTWIDIWRNIAWLEGLRYLHVELEIYQDYRRHWTEVEDEILEPIKKVVAPQVFELILPFPENPKGRVAKELPCTPIRNWESSR